MQKDRICFLLFQPLLFLFLFDGEVATAQNNYTLSGQIVDARSGETLPGANLYVDELKTGTSANAYGFFSMLLPEGEHTVVFSYVGYSSLRKVVNVQRNERIEVRLEGSVELEAVEVVAQSRLSDDILLGRMDLPLLHVKGLPALGGEKDIIKVLQLMPGIQRQREGSSGFHVRGGGGDQNLIILDEATVYNATHVFGFLSLFNGDAIKDVHITTGGFPARYGGRLSSVLDITMKDGRQDKIGGEVGIGLVSSRVLLEGPLVNDKVTFLVAGRRTYYDLLTKPFLSDGETLDFYFYDSNAKLKYRVNNNNHLFVSAYLGRDKVNSYDREANIQERNSLYWQNQTFTMRWNRIIDDRMFSNTSLIFSDYSMNVDYEESMSDVHYYRMKYFNGIRNYTLKHDFFMTPLQGHNLRMGGVATFHRFVPGTHSIESNSEEIDETTGENLEMLESAIYVEDEFQYRNIRGNLGLRLASFFTSESQYFFAEPRLSIAYDFPRGFTLRSSFAQMNQAIHMLSSMGAGMSVDLWLPAGKNMDPQFSRQWAMGVSKFYAPWEVEFTVEGYYKQMSRILAYKPGVNFMTLNDPLLAAELQWHDLVTQGDGVSRGLELMARKKAGRLSGWIAYTLSKIDLTFPELNGGKTFPAAYDRRHDLAITGLWQINARIKVSASWLYSTGSPFTLPVGTFQPYIPSDFSDQGDFRFYRYNYVDYAEVVNNFRMENFHRLDFGIQFIKKKKVGTRTWEISLYNAYNRKNPYYYSFRTRYETGEKYLKKSSFLPLIPSITYSRSF